MEKAQLCDRGEDHLFFRDSVMSFWVYFKAKASWEHKHFKITGILVSLRIVTRNKLSFFERKLTREKRTLRTGGIDLMHATKSSKYRHLEMWYIRKMFSYPFVQFSILLLWKLNSFECICTSHDCFKIQTFKYLKYFERDSIDNQLAFLDMTVAFKDGLFKTN